MKKTISLLLFVCSLGYSELINLDKNESINISPKDHDVKFIFESSLSTASWEPGVSDDTNQKLLDYDTEGLNLYSLKGKVNIFDSDVLTIEKYGSFAGTTSQSKLIQNYKKEKKDDSTVAGLNISVKAFLLLKYFYLGDYNYLDALEYQYSSYKFYGVATIMSNTFFWYGSTTKGEIEKDFFPLSKGSTISFYTDFNEHRFYILQLANLIKSPIDSIKVGIYSTNWLRPTFLGSKDQASTPIIHHAELTSDGITLDIKHKFLDTLDTGLIINYGLDNYINYTSNSLDVDFFSYDLYIDYMHNIYTHKQYDIFANLRAFMSKKNFSSSGHDLDDEDIKGISFGISVLF